jgi:hypothetical protein
VRRHPEDARGAAAGEEHAVVGLDALHDVAVEADEAAGRIEPEEAARTLGHPLQVGRGHAVAPVELTQEALAGGQLDGGPGGERDRQAEMGDRSHGGLAGRK